MIKKAAAFLTAIMLLVTLCACTSVDEGYEAAIKQSSIPNTSSDDSQSDQQSDNTDESKEENPTTPSVSVEWPEGIPAITEYKTMIEEKWLADGSFSVQCLLTKEQYEGWIARLKSAGFESSPATALGWTVEWKATAQSDGGYRLKLGVVKAAEQTATESGWPAAFAEFPEYNGDGSFSYTVTSENSNQMVLTAKGETRTGFERYTEALTTAGFSKDGAVYSKSNGNLIYTVDTSGAWIDTDTVSVTFSIVQNNA